MDRTKTTWVVQLQDEAGNVGPYELSTYWDPNLDDSAEAVKAAAAAEAFVKAGKQRRFFPISAERKED